MHYAMQIKPVSSESETSVCLTNVRVNDTKALIRLDNLISSFSKPKFCWLRN